MYLRSVSLLCLAVVVAVGAVVAPAAPALADVDPGVPSPTSVTVAPTDLGLKLSWQQPATDQQVTGYHITSSDGLDEHIAGDLTTWIVDVEKPGVEVTASIATEVGESESEPVSATPAAALSPAGLTRILETPIPLVNTATALGVSGPLAAATPTTVSVDGVDGIPSTGISALILSVVAGGTKSAGLTLWPTGETQPATATLTALAKQTEARTVVVGLGSDRSLSLLSSAGPATISITVLGYQLTAAAAGKSADGKVVTVAPVNALKPTRIAAKAYKEVQVLGLAGVPAAGVRAALVRVTITAASKLTSLTVGAAGASSAVPVLSAPKATSTIGLVFSPVSSSGKVRIKNGSGAATIRADVVGWTSDGSGSEAPAAPWTRMQSPAVAFDTAKGVGTTKSAMKKAAVRTVVVAGVAGVPAAGADSPAVSVLLRATATSSPTSKSSSFSIYGAGGSSTVASVAGAPKRATPALAWVTLPASGKLSTKSLVGTANLKIEVLGWSVGAPTLMPKAVVLTDGQASKYGSLSGDQLPLVGSAPAPTVGQVLAASPTGANPYGFLRRVVDVQGDAASGFQITTVAATLDEVLRNADVTTEISIGKPVETITPPDAGVKPTSATSAKGRAPTSDVRHPDGSASFSTGISKSFSFSSDPGGAGSVTLSGTAGFTATAAVAVHVGWRGVKAEMSLKAQQFLNAKLAATGAASFGRSIELGEFKFAVMEIPIGPVILVVQPEIDLTLSANAGFEASADVTFNQGTSGEIGFKYDHGFHKIAEFSNTKPTVATHASLGFSASVNLAAAGKLVFYGTGYATAGLTVGANIGYTAPDCYIDTNGGVDAEVSVGIDLPFVKDVSQSESFHLFDFDIPDIRMPGASGCPWTGTITVTSSWVSKGKWINGWDPEGPKAAVESDGASTGMTFHRVVPPGQMAGYWWTSGANQSVTEVPNVFHPECSRVVSTSLSSETAAKAAITWKDQWNFAGPVRGGDTWIWNTPGWGEGTTITNDGCNPVSDDYFSADLDRGVGAILDYAASHIPGGHTVSSTASSVPAAICLHSEYQWCSPPSVPYPEIATSYLGDDWTTTGSLSVKVQLTNLKDDDSNGIPD